MEIIQPFIQFMSSLEGQRLIVIIVFALTIIAFIADKIRSDIVALSSLALLLVTNVLTPKEALSGFSNSAVVMMIGLFVVGGAVFQTGLAKTISGRLLKLAGTNEKILFFLVMMVTSVVAAFVSNTGTVALLLPIILAMSKTAGIHPGKLMMPLAFASSLGGTLTLIGTPPNLIVDAYLRDNGKPGFGFFDFLPIGLVGLAVGLVLLYPLCQFFLGKKTSGHIDTGEQQSLASLLHDYQINDLVFRLTTLEGTSRLVGCTVGELDIRQKYNISILEIRRSNRSVFSASIQEMVNINTLFEPGDTIYVLGERKNVDAFAAEYQLSVFEDEEREGKGKLDFYEIGLAEILISPDSALLNRPLREARFRERFDVDILAVKRQGHYLFEGFLNTDVKSGDMLLVHGKWKGIESMAKKNREWIVIGSPSEDAESVALDHKAPLAAAIMVIMVLVMVFADYIGIKPVAAVIIAGLLMVLTRCVRSVDAAYKMIGWESIVLIAAMMPMSIALSKTGISEWIASTLVENLKAFSPIVVMGGVYCVTSLLSTFISNSATSILVAPIAWAAAIQLGVSPTPFMMAAAVGASACFATPICTPPNAMVMNAGHYNFMDYVKIGVPLQIIIGIVSVLVIPLLFPF